MLSNIKYNKYDPKIGLMTYMHWSCGLLLGGLCPVFALKTI